MTTMTGAAYLVFRGSQRFFFSQDDFFFLYRAAQISSFRELLEAFLAQDRFFYRPWPRVFMFFAQWRLFGWDAGTFHLVSIALQAFNGCLVYWLMNQIFQRGLLAGITAVLFVSHPASFLAVYWISGIQDLSMTAFLLLSLWLYLKGREAGGGARAWFKAFSVTAFALALLSKETALVGVFLLPLVDWVQDRQRNRPGPWRPPIGRLAPYLGVLLCYLLVSSRTFSAVMTAAGPYGFAISPRVPAANFSFYLGEIFFLKNATSIPPLAITVISFLVGAALAAFALTSRPGRPVGAFGIVWFLITLSPVLLMTQRTYSYYAYLSLTGVMSLLAWPILSGLAFVDHRFRTPPGNRLRSLAAGSGLGLLLFLWLGLSLIQVQAKEIEDPAGILSKSILAQTAFREIKVRYPEIPPGSELCLLGAGERERWAVGHGDLFRLLYPGIRVSFIDEREWTSMKNNTPNLYWFQIPRFP
jgi:hypothetical protein